MAMTVRTSNFNSALRRTEDNMVNFAKQHLRGKWQGLDVSKKREMTAYEMLHYTIQVPLYTESLDAYRTSIKPNLPWADDHFEERVSGFPLNPGKEWANWPWGKSADKFREASGIFDHNYMERYWPKKAGNLDDNPVKDIKDIDSRIDELNAFVTTQGIRFPYGDLYDVMKELKEDPTTRQAVLPIFFPEDTGRNVGRKPCSMYYHFMLTADLKLDITYPMRSCDMVRHLRDDIYLTVRLLLWVLNELRSMDPTFWTKVEPGMFDMPIANLHCFENDMIQLKQARLPEKL